MEGIGTLSPVDIRRVLADAATEFTPRLAESADLLGEAPGLLHERTPLPRGERLYLLPAGGQGFHLPPA